MEFDQMSNLESIAQKLLKKNILMICKKVQKFI